jgi:hypothetical protein
MYKRSKLSHNQLEITLGKVNRLPSTLSRAQAHCSLRETLDTDYEATQQSFHVSMRGVNDSMRVGLIWSLGGDYGLVSLREGDCLLRM